MNLPWPVLPLGIPQEAAEIFSIELDGLGGLALAAAVEDVALNEGLNTGDHKNMIQVVVAYLFHAVLARFSLKSRGGRIRTGDHLNPIQVRYLAALHPAVSVFQY